MKLIRLITVTYLLFAVSVYASDEADVIYYGGSILTMSDNRPQAEAVAVAGGKVLAVGSSQEIMKLQGNETQLYDLNNQTMIPGFVDAHGHVLMIGLQALSANMLPAPDGQVNDIKALQRTL
ncbi:MAG: amidohydrolase, partial [Gammaproteobacteria bacterium]|nr:amidohydrolase [Gammaproteobacteria bacterium]